MKRYRVFVKVSEQFEYIISASDRDEVEEKVGEKVDADRPDCWIEDMRITMIKQGEEDL